MSSGTKTKKCAEAALNQLTKDRRNAVLRIAGGISKGIKGVH
jgi:hypothetical protein